MAMVLNFRCSAGFHNTGGCGCSGSEVAQTGGHGIVKHFLKHLAAIACATGELYVEGKIENTVHHEPGAPGHTVALIAGKVHAKEVQNIAHQKGLKK